MIATIGIVLIVLTLLLMINLGYIFVRMMGDARASRWGWVAAGVASMIGVLGLLLLMALLVFGLRPMH